MRALALAAALVVGAPPVVPWLDRHPVKASAHPPLAPPCRASGLHAQLFLQGATGSLVGGVELTNAGRHACSLVGRPRAAFAEGSSKWRVQEMPRREQPPLDVLADPVGSLRALAPGRTAEVALWWSNWCGTGAVETGSPGQPPAALELGLPGGTDVVLKLTQAPRCDRPSTPSLLSVGPFAPATRSLGPSSRLPLAARILGPRPVAVKPGLRAFRARRGSLLHYVVALRNTGAKPFRFASCPVYVESLDPSVEDAYVLNCRPAGTIAPHATVRFAMEIRVPANARLGVTALGWNLAPTTYLAPFADAAVQIVP